MSDTEAVVAAAAAVVALVAETDPVSSTDQYDYGDALCLKV